MAEPVATQSPIQRFLSEESDFDELISKLAFPQELAIKAAAEQPGLFIKAARARVQTMRRSAQAHANLDTTEADVALQTRAALVSRGEKITEATVAALVAIDAAVLDAQKAARAADSHEELGKLIVEAYRHRRDVIRVIAEANIIEGNNPYTDEMRFDQTRKLSEEARAAQAKRRQAAALEDATE